MTPNIKNFFLFLEEKEKKEISNKIKFTFFNDELTNDDLTINGYVDFTLSPFKKLPNNMRINGYLDLSGSSIETLPENLFIKEGLNLNGTKVYEFPDSINLNGNLRMGVNKFITTPKDVKKLWIKHPNLNKVSYTDIRFNGYRDIRTFHFYRPKDIFLHSVFNKMFWEILYIKLLA
jgi:hypothetical protein